MEKGTTYIVRPRIEPRNSSVSVARISSGSTQLLVGPASSGCRGADEGALLDPGDVGGVRAGPVAARALGVRELGERPPVHEQPAQPVVLVGRAVAPLDPVGLGERSDSVDPVEELAVASLLASTRSYDEAGPARSQVAGAVRTGALAASQR